MWKEPIFLLNRHCAAFILLVSCLLTGSDNLYSRKKTIANEPDGHVYVIAGAVFLKTPSIFHRFMAEQREALRPLKIDNWRDVQRQFEKINLHRRQRGGANVYQCRNRESQKVYHGYLVPAKEIYGAATVPADTPLLEVSSLN
ncbi:conjugal transfer nickase/helicase domain-containing protein [Klebsiella pneumoniae]|uniref:conjugal transfer nickase/helicase domain-containing protein n=1 Tax=Klebsiella pneumoniae TaxID=573 RepID=UPI0034E89E1B